MTLENLKQNPNCLLLDAISGSRAYGTNIATSDTDIRGVFVMPQKIYYGLNHYEQISDEKNDIVYYELGRFIDLLLKNNPNILELLATPADCILYKHPSVAAIKIEDFLSKQCLQTFAGYAISQVKKARGLNKKIVNPMDEKRKSVCDFCHITKGIGSQKLSEWLERQGFRQEDCGLVALSNMKDMYALFHKSQDTTGGYFAGVQSSDEANDVNLTSIPKGITPLVYLHFNKDGYSKYCKDYREYFAWVNNRNEARYQNTVEHSKNYDAKNMMHVFRLLNMAADIAEKGAVIVRRPERDFLLKIRSGVFEYEDLLAKAEEKLAAVETLFAKSTLPDMPNVENANDTLITLREMFYAK